MNKSKSRNMAQTMLLLPAVLPVIFFSVAPIGYGLFLAFTNARAGNNLQFEFTGLENFQRLMSDTPFLESLGLEKTKSNRKKISRHLRYCLTKKKDLD